MIEKIIVCGFMGAGKSFFANEFTKKMSPAWKVIDLDSAIAQSWNVGDDQLGKEIQKRGFAKFREAEVSLFEEKMRDQEKMLISLGGGALENDAIFNKAVSSDNGILVWLNDSFDECWERVKHCQNRPLVALGKEALKERFLQREKKYSQAKLVINSYELQKLLDFLNTHQQN